MSKADSKTAGKMNMPASRVTWTEKKRLLMYLGFAFGLTWIVFIPYILTGNTWDGEESFAMNQFVSLGMLCPMIGMLLTRFFSKEGFAVTGEGSMMLGIDFRGKKWIWYLVAVFLPWLYHEAGTALYLLISPAAFSGMSEEVLELLDGKAGNVIWLPLVSIVTGVVASFAALGEEAGWRGYMMPKMIRLWGVKKAVLVGGVLWGMWHWPLTVIGHNFGRDYFGYPYTGMLCMCILCIFIGILLTYVTYKTGSVWPAVFLHAVNNAVPSILSCFMDTEKVTGWRSDSIVRFLVMNVPVIVIGIGVLIFDKKFRKLGCKK